MQHMEPQRAVQCIKLRFHPVTSMGTWAWPMTYREINYFKEENIVLLSVVVGAGSICRNILQVHGAGVNLGEERLFWSHTHTYYKD